MTLKVCGGVPRVISEKSAAMLDILYIIEDDVQLTLSIEEVLDWHGMTLITGVHRSFLEHLIDV